MRTLGRLRLGYAALALLAVVSLVGCDWTFVITWNTLSGKVVDARIDPDDGEAGISGVAMALVDAGGTTVATATSGSTGSFTFDEVEPGSYTITAELTGYAFISKPVVVAGNDLEIPGGKVLGFSSASATDISIIAVWSDDFLDVDSYLTYPTEDNYTAGANPTLDNPYDFDGTGLDVDGGFFAAFPEDDRETVSYGNKESTATTADWGGDASTAAVKLDVDITDGSGPETITIKAPTVPALNLDHTTLSTNAATTGLPDTNDFAWVGVMEYYVDSFGTPSLSTEGEAGGAQVEVYIIQGADIKGRFVVPDYVDMETASVIRINMFVRDDDVSFFQFVPDIRIADYTGIKGLSNGIVTLQGAAR